MKNNIFHTYMKYFIIVMIWIFSSKSLSRILDQEGDHNEQNFTSVTNELPVIMLTETLFDFGVISQGQKVSHVFQFKNIGKYPLIIYGAKGSCWCTIPDH
ncbi:MAG: DUF1573 domain-containing protein [Flavobacteriales bacterium]